MRLIIVVIYQVPLLCYWGSLRQSQTVSSDDIVDDISRSHIHLPHRSKIRFFFLPLDRPSLLPVRQAFYLLDALFTPPTSDQYLHTLEEPSL